MPSLHLRSPLAALAATAILALSCPAQSVRWEVSLDSALAQAAEAGTIVVIAIQMPGERASDEMLAEHYSDPKIVELSRATVNLLLEVGPAVGSPPPDDRLVRERYLKVGPEDLVAVPHHLFIKPGGEGGEDELLSSFAYRVTMGQLEWAWADAIRKVVPEFEYEASGRTRAPESLRFGSAGGSGTPPPPTKAEVKAAIDALEKGRGGWGAAFGHYRVILASDQREALKFGEQRMRSLNGMMLRAALRTIGDVSPTEWYKTVVEYLDHRDDDTREEAARALERLAEPKSLTATRKQYGREENDVVRGRLLRAMVAEAPDEKNVLRAVGKAFAGKEDSVEVRVQAAVAAGQLEDRKAVEELLVAALADEDDKVRSAAAYALAARRDADLRQLLADREAVEGDEAVKRWLTAGLAVIDGGDIDTFEPLVRQVIGDRERGDDLKRMQAQFDRMQQRGRGRGTGDSGADGGLPAPKDPPR